MDINGYSITEELRSDNAGNSSWGCAFKNGEKYFIKQLKETYLDKPYEKASLFERETMDAARAFEGRMNRLCDLLRKSDNGNLVVPLEFIRHDGRYYLVTQWIDQFSDFREIRKFTEFQKHLMMKVLAYSLCGLADHNIVHCDLKPDNIRIKDTVSNAKTLKIIDFDNGFIAGDYPDMIGGTQNYMSPEVIVRTNQDEEGLEDKIAVTTKADIFSLGVIYHEILTAELPKSSDDRFSYIGVAVGNGAEVVLNKGLPPEYSDLILQMLSLEPDQRPDAAAVFHALKEIDPLSLNYRR